MAIRTKIICTIGPAVASKEKIIELIEAGMDVARLNFSHGTHQEHLQTIHFVKEARQQLGTPVAIMLDTQGPEIRVGELKDGSVKLLKGDRVHLIQESLVGNKERFSIYPPQVLKGVDVNHLILFDDGYISSEVVELTGEGVVIEIKHGGVLKSRKGVNIPGVQLNLPAVTDKDKEDIRFGCLHGIDVVAASFIRSGDNVYAVKKFLKEEGHSDVMVIAKIENREGVDNFDSIVQIADGIMIARGDLGVEVPLSEVPVLQKMMIRKCYLSGKPAVTATQMLESMIHNPRPTRAEVSDVANAIYDSTSAVMLSGETAVGEFPVETVKMMRGIIKRAEADFDYKAHFEKHSSLVFHDVSSSLTLAAVKTAYSSNACAIFAFTTLGGTARLLSRLRPEMPVVAMTPHEKTYHQLALSWGVVPFKSDVKNSVEEAFEELSRFALDQGVVTYGDLVVVTAGSPFGVSGTTNMMIVESIGDVLVRGYGGCGERVYGKVMFVMSADAKQPYEVKDRLIVIPKCDETFFPILKNAKGIILQNHIDDLQSEHLATEFAVQNGSTLIIRADGASSLLHEGQLVTLDPTKALVYNGASL